MGSFSKNYEAISLTGNMNAATLGNGISAETVHQIYCLSAGTISIQAMGGGTFFWTGTTNSFIDVVPASITAITGTFIGFRSKNTGISYVTRNF
jgi:TPP-dependent indolepyruvate ferredoxin oxidoreductase alpha subunit